jgi:hypothetical protein
MHAKIISYGCRQTVLVVDGSGESRDESSVDNFRIRSDLNPNYADMEKSF